MNPQIKAPRVLRFALCCGLALAAAVPLRALAEANYVYHERTGNDVTGGAANTCGGAQAYVPVLNPTSAQSYLLRWKTEYQFYTDNLRVYYTTDGSTPSGAFGVGSGTTTVVSGSYQCTFTAGANQVDVCNATIPAQPAGTVVKYIVSAWHSGGGLEIFANGPGTPCACGTPTSTAAQATVFEYTVGSTTDLYWDINGSTAGAGGATPTGTWDGALANWSSVFDGTAATGIWTAGRNAIFSAGSDASGAFTVTVTGTQTAGGMTIQEGTVSIAGGVVAVGAGNVTVNSGATLSTDSNLRLTATAGATMTVNGGTVRTTNPGAAGTFVDTDFIITLGAAGGTFSHTTANILNIVQTASKITGPGSLTKTGAGVLAFAGTLGNNDYAGATIVNDGELRIRTVPNTLPIATAVTVTSPGILNLNGVSQKIGSLAGNGDVGTGSGTLTIEGSTSTIFNGALKNIANAGAGGVTTGNGRLVKNGSSTITFNGANDIRGSVTLNDGGITVSSGASLCGTIADLTVNGGTLTLNNSLQVIENLSGSGGTIQLGSGHTLTTDPVASTTYSGVIAGPGSLVKSNMLSGATVRTLTLNGPNTYDGNTLVGGGKMAVGSASALGSSAGYTEVAAGAELIFDGAATTFACSEPIRIAGGGAGGGGAITIQNASAPTLSGPITLTGDATITVSSSASAIFSNPNAITSLANQNLTLQGGANAAGTKAITGVINLGSGGLTKLQGGEWILSAQNVYSGPTAISAGTLVAASADALGSAAGGTTVSSGAALGIKGGIIYSTAEPVSIAGTGISSGGAITNQSGDNSFAGPVTMTANSSIGAASGSSLTLSGGIGGAFDLTKVGAGTLILSSANTPNNTAISAGKLVVNGSLGGGAVTVAAAGTLGGSGTVSGTVAVNGTIAPGASIGTLSTGSETWAGGGSYEVEMNNAAGTEGVDPGWDLLNITGTLDITATSGSKFNIKLVSPGGPAASFDNTKHRVWRIAKTTGGVTGFAADKFAMDVTGFANGLASGQFTVAVRGNDLYLAFWPDCSAEATSRAHLPVGTDMTMTFESLLGLVQAQTTVAVNCTVTGTAYDVDGNTLATGLAIPVMTWADLPVGTTKVLLVAAKTNPLLSATVNTQVKDFCGNVEGFDPLITTLEVTAGDRVEQRFEGLHAAERYVQVINGTPGLSRLELNLNGRHLQMDLTAGQRVTADLGAAMREGYDNVLVLTGYGEVGASALVVLTDVEPDDLVTLDEIVLLTLGHSAAGLTLTWPETLEGWQLQSSPTANTGWADVTTPPTAANGQWTLTLAPTAGAQFYRLTAPTGVARPATTGTSASLTPATQPSKTIYDALLW